MAKTLTLTLLIDKSTNRVIFAESDNRFVDVIFSFLTLPMATIVRLLGRRSSLGSLDRLYSSVETIDPQFLHSPSCKSMLLNPRNVSGLQCQTLAINMDDFDHRVYYKCGSCRKVSSVSGPRCECGRILDVPVAVVGGLNGEGRDVDGVFVKGEVGRFMVSDDLTVRPVSMGESLGLLRRLGIEDGNVLEKRVVEVGKDEIMKLLKRSLVSKMPLTDVFLQEPEITIVDEKLVLTDITQSRFKHKRTSHNSKRINVKLYLSTDSDKVVYAETGEDFVDLIFSFLTFPLGSVIKLLEKSSSMGCIDNLYESVEVLSSSNFGHMKSEECKSMLLDPMLPPFYGCHHQLLSIKEVSAETIRTWACKTCKSSTNSDQCSHGMFPWKYSEINPKRQNSSSSTGDGYARGMVKFMVTDEMEVTPLSPISGFHIINKLMVPIGSLEEAEASLGEVEALNLLKACFISPTVLSDVFSPYLMTLLQQNWCGRLPRKYDGCPY